MNAHWLAQGIRFNDCLFTEPTQLASWVPPKYAGLFVILVSDPNWAPKPFQPLYFGEFGNNTQRSLSPADQMRLVTGAGTQALFVSVFAMPFSTTTQRLSVRDQLIGAYNPLSQAEESSFGTNSLRRKMDELERRHEEQTTDLHLLLATVNKLFEPEPPRRRIGFLPDCPSGS